MKGVKELLKTIGDDFNRIYSLPNLLECSMIVFCAEYLLDCWNLPTMVIEKISLPAFVVICIVASAIVVMRLYGTHFFELYKATTVNPLDYILCVMLLSTVLYVLMRMTTLGWRWHTGVALGICLIIVRAVSRRVSERYSKIQSLTNEESRLVDLKDLYEGNIKYTEDPILLLETDVEYDLMDRQTTINQIYQSIICCQSQVSYVIGLCGAWGTGKTTIINNVKRMLQNPENSYVIVDGFDPWLYGSPEALFGAMLDVLLDKTGIHYKAYLTSKKIKNIAKAITDDNMVGGLAYNLLPGAIAFGEEIDAMRERLRSYIRMSGKQYIFFIDNLDRASDDNIIFLFKIISVVLDLPGIVYVLSYEKERIETVLKETHEYDARFIEKIIQQEINIPALNKEAMRRVFGRSIQNILIAHGFVQKEITRFKPAVEYSLNKIENVRQFKRMVNTVFSSSLSAGDLLCKSDLLSIELIRFFDPLLYDEIRRHPSFFVSHDQPYTDVFSLGMSHREFNQQGKSFFDKILEGKENEKKLLKSVFPYVDRYSQDQQLVSDYIIQTDEDKRIAKECRVCSGKYFNLYFSYGTNYYLKVSGEINRYIREINAGAEKEDVVKIAESWVDRIALADQDEWVTQLQARRDEISERKRLATIIGLVQSSDRVDNIPTFITSPHGRISYIIADLLSKCQDSELHEYVEFVKGKYKYLYLFREIYISLEREKERNNAVGNIDTVLEAYNDMCLEILESKIDIYDEEYYAEENLEGLIYYADSKKKEEELQNFFKKILTSKNIYRFLWDCIGHSTGNEHKYYFRVELLERLLGDETIVDRYIKERPPITESEAIVKEMYEKYKCRTDDVHLINRYSVPSPLRLSL